jgi:hypothetical protein
MPVTIWRTKEGIIRSLSSLRATETSGRNRKASIRLMYKEGHMKCKHDGCKCSAAEGKKGYCSDDCAKGTMQGNRCGCGHPACK